MAGSQEVTTAVDAEVTVVVGAVAGVRPAGGVGVGAHSWGRTDLGFIGMAQYTLPFRAITDER